MDKHEVTRYLTEIDEQDMLDILQEVFTNRHPYSLQVPDENRYFLGLAVRDTADLDQEETDPNFKEWGIIATAYPDRNEYPFGMKGWGFVQFGVCQNCGFEVASMAKRAFCSICGNKVHLS